MAWATVIILWLTDARLSKTSAYPLVDFTFRTQDVTAGQPVATRDILAATGPTEADDSDVRAAVKGMKLAFRSVVEPALPIGAQIKAWLSRKPRKNSPVKT